METFAETINGNWEVLRDEIEPHLNSAVGRATVKILNQILETMPYEDFFKEEE